MKHKAFYLAIMYMLLNSILDAGEYQIKWIYNAGGDLSNISVDSNNCLYFVKRPNSLVALSNEGKLKWSLNIGYYLDFSPSVGNNGIIYVSGTVYPVDGFQSRHYLYAIKPDSTLKWRYELSNGAQSSPVINRDGTIYVGTFDGYIHAVDTSGQLKWKFDTGGSVSFEPAISTDSTIYVCGGEHNLYLFAFTEFGDILWEVKSHRPIASHASPAVDSEGTVYFGTWSSHNDKVYAVNNKGNVKWTINLEKGLLSSIVIGDNNNLFFLADEKYVYSVNKKGKLIWKHDIGEVGTSTPAIGSNNNVYLSSNDGLYSFKTNGELNWINGFIYSRYTSPLINRDSTLCISASDGKIYVLKIFEKLASSSWPMLNHDEMRSGCAKK